MLFLLLCMYLLFVFYSFICVLGRVIKVEKSLNKLYFEINKTKKKLKDLEIDTEKLFDYIDNIYIEIEGL